MSTRPEAAAARASPRRKRAEEDAGQVSEISTGKIFLVVLAFAALLVGLYIQVAKNLSETLRQQSSASSSSAVPPSASNVALNAALTAATGRSDPSDTLVVADNMDAGYLDHIVDALLKFGHKLSFTGSLTPQKVEQDLDRYDLIWMHDYPFQSVRKLRPHQRINHFPGTGFITNKLTLSTTPHLPHVLKAFRLPHERQQFIEFAQSKQLKQGAQAQVLWIRKSSGHRGISIETLEGILSGAQRAEDGSDILVQEYMANPLLIDGKKFDIGIYAVLTSVEPLRVYIYDSESLLRFCSQPYLDPTSNQFNGSNLDSYVVGDDYTPIWLMPTLLRYYIGASLSMKQTLNTYLKRARLGEGARIWAQIEETIKHVYKSKEHHLARMGRMFQEANNYNGTSVEGALNQFFEMVRFDFIVDDQLQVYLMEANMSPNLSSRHFPPNRLLYEQVLASYFNLVGLNPFARQHLASAQLPVRPLNGDLERLERPNTSGERRGLDELISEKELSVYEDLCVSDECHMDCRRVDCRACHFCLSYADKLHLRRAIYEHHSRWNFKRLLPSTRDQDLELQARQPDQAPGAARGGAPVVDANYIHVQWFRGKCFSDARFCSY